MRDKQFVASLSQGPFFMTADIYVELVKSLHATAIPALIMGGAFALIGADVVSETRDRMLLALLICGIAAIVARLLVIVMFRRKLARQPIDPAWAGRAERRFAICFLAFSFAFGLFAARAFLLGSADTKLTIIALVFGYGAGVASSVMCRPWIALPSMMMGVMPTVVVTYFANTGVHFALGLLTTVFLVGGIEAQLRHYRQLAKSVWIRQAISRWEARDRPLIDL